MKKVKKILTMLLAAVMVLSMTAVAFAADTYSVTIENYGGHTFKAYQIFKGNFDPATGKLGNIEWGTGVNSTTLLDALKNDETLAADFGTCETAAAVAVVLDDYRDDAANLIQFAQFAAKAKTVGTSGAEDPSNTANYIISGLEAGYYVIVDETTGLNEKEDALSRAILRIVEITNNVSVKVKKEVPEIKKTVVSVDANGNVVKDQKVNAAGVGTVVYYEIAGTVPNYDGYDNYTYTISDKLSKGLNFNDDVVVTIANRTLEKGTDYIVSDLVEDPEDGSHTFTVAFNNIKQHKQGDVILVKYTATINDKAVVGSTGNSNEAILTYSNDPYSDGIGTTVPTKTFTYLTEIELTKYADKAVAGNELEGAGFTLTGTAYDVFLNEKGEYTTEAREVSQNVVSDANGVVKFTGLGEGTFTIEETTVPAGYNKAENTVVITSFDKQTRQWTVSANDTVNTNGTIYTLKVVNHSGAVLPSTGGMGTTLFYLIGAALVLGAGVILVTRRRMSMNEK